MQVIALAGQLCVGKDEVADYLVQRLNGRYDRDDPAERVRRAFPDRRRWERASFAGAVKKVFCDAFGVDLAFIEAWKRNPAPPPGMLMPVRQALQFIGDGFRQI